MNEQEQAREYAIDDALESEHEVSLALESVDASEIAYEFCEWSKSGKDLDAYAVCTAISHMLRPILGRQLANGAPGPKTPASVVAAAPDMLRALQWLDRVERGEASQKDNAWYWARVAIAKAEGKA